MSTKNRLFSKKFSLTEHGGKYGIVKEEKTILHPVYDSIWEMDNDDFIIEQNGKFGYAHFNTQGERELILPCYDVIIKKKHGLSLYRREKERQYFWYDTNSYTLFKSFMHIKSFKNYDLFVSTKKCYKGKMPFLKKWGENKIIEIPFDTSADILYDIDCGEYTYFLMIEEAEGEYEYSFLIVKENSDYTFSVTKKSVLELYEILPNIMEDVKCNKSIVWNIAKQA